MKLSKFLMAILAGATVMGLSASLPWAACVSGTETYALFGCAELAYFAAPPTGETADNITAVFWQIGFGNGTLDTGNGTDGTGNEAAKIFNGNDTGLRFVDVRDATDFNTQIPPPPAPGFPAGSLCLGGNNWATAGVDGCPDNPRAAKAYLYYNQYNYLGYYQYLYGGYYYNSDDNILNPYFGQYAAGTSRPGIYSISGIQDYPTAVMLKTPGDGWFALAAVANLDRSNTGGNGPCAPVGYTGTNAAACDVVKGWYSWRSVVNGLTNVMDGLNDVVPWQQVLPVPAGTGLTTVTWNPAFWNHDGSVMPTNNPAMRARNSANGTDTTRAEGPGMVDLQRKWNGLIRYDLEVATGVADANGFPDWPSLSWGTAVDDANVPIVDVIGPLDANGDPNGPVTVSMNVNPGDCLRVRTKVGKQPETLLTGKVGCRLGKCGDVGYEVVPAGPHGVKCVYGGALSSETITKPNLDRGKGRYRLTWETSGELTVTGFEILGVTHQGPRLIRNVACSQCSTGLNASYDVSLSPSEVKGGVRAFQIKMLGGNGTVA